MQIDSKCLWTFWKKGGNVKKRGKTDDILLSPNCAQHYGKCHTTFCKSKSQYANNFYVTWLKWRHILKHMCFSKRMCAKIETLSKMCEQYRNHTFCSYTDVWWQWYPKCSWTVCTLRHFPKGTPGRHQPNNWTHHTNIPQGFFLNEHHKHNCLCTPFKLNKPSSSLK